MGSHGRASTLEAFQHGFRLRMTEGAALSMAQPQIRRLLLDAI
jgi:hypothetical protein